jgi:glycosyltransferase involved in cell wall biosynthesis
MRDVVAWSDRRRPAPLVEDWSRPLITPASGAKAPRTALTGTPPAHTRLDVVGPATSHESARVDEAGPPAMRCLIVTSRLDVGGMDEVVAFLARRLPARQLRTAVLHATPDAPGDGEPAGRLGRMLRASGIEVHAADQRRGPAWIEQWRPGMISAHGAPDWVFAAARRAGVPYVDNLHGMHRLFGADWRWHAEAARCGKLSAVVAVSELVRQQYLADNPGFPRGRIVTIPNGVDDERRPPADRARVRDRLGLTDEYLFVSLARHSLQKNSYGLLTAFGELARHRPQAHLVIAGRPDDIRYYRRVLRLRDSQPWRGRIHLRDHVAAPAELLAAADGFVLDSFFEGWSLASMEALFAGLPVVLSDVGGAREQIDGDVTRGYLVANPLGDPLEVDWTLVGAALYRAQANRDELAAAMDALVTSRKDYLAARGRLAAESAARFSADACLARHAAVLRAAATGADLPDMSNVRATPHP